jgi:hypothetical protein
MTTLDSPKRAAAELARLLATAVQRRQGRGTPGATPPATTEAEGRRVQQLIANLSADAAAIDGFFPALGRELKARGLHMPSLDLSHLPAELAPLLGTLEAVLAPAAEGDGSEIDAEAAAQQLSDQLRALLGESPREARERMLGERSRTRAGARVAAAMRRQGLVPERDQPAQGDSFWDLVEIARGDPEAFVRRLGQLPRERLADFYWEHRAAVMELQRAGLGAGLPNPEQALLAAQVVASGHAAHAAAVIQPAQPVPGMPGTPVDLGREALRVFSERFGEPLAPGMR